MSIIFILATAAFVFVAAQQQGPAAVSSNGVSIAFQNNGGDAAASNGVSISFQNASNFWNMGTQGVTIGFGVPRPLTMSPFAGSQGTTFRANGGGFTPGGNVTLYYIDPVTNGLTVAANTVASAAGQITASYTTSCSNPPGTYSFIALDSASSTFSNSSGILLASDPKCRAYGDTRLDEAYPGDLGSKTPVILIHGLHGNGKGFPSCIDSSTEPNIHYFKNLILHLNNSADYNLSYKTYRFHWVSDRHTTRDLARALRDQIDNKPEFANKKIIIVTHSTGALIARHYLNLATHSGNSSFANQQAGQLVKKLITLAGPHHGTYAANGDARAAWILVPSQYSRFLSLTDEIYWRKNCAPDCVNNLQHPNRSSLLWDDFNGFWRHNYVYQTNVDEINQELNIPTTYNRRIIAYWGEVSVANTEWRTVLAAAASQNQLLDLISEKYTYGVGTDLQAALAAYLIHGIKIANFSTLNIFPENDGLLPVESSRFDLPSGTNSQLMGSVHCRGYNHRQLLDGDWRTCENGKILLDSVLSDILTSNNLVRRTNSLPAILLGPERAAVGYVTTGTSGQTEIDLYNSGDAGLQITSLNITGSDADQFSILNPPTAPIAIPAKGVTRLTVQFNPTSTGAKTANLIATNNSNNPSLSVTLEGFGMPASCDVQFSPPSRYVPMAGESGSFPVGNIPCSWSVSTNDAWIHPTAVGELVNYTVDTNTTGVPRDGVIFVSIYGRAYTFSISQGSSNSTCWVDMPNGLTVLSQAGSSSFYVTTPDTCSWDFQSDSSWITLETPGVLQGSRQINLNVLPNTSNSTRYGTITVNGQDSAHTLSITQPGGGPSGGSCTYSLSPDNQSAPVSGGTYNVSLTTGDGCAWQAIVSSGWLNITSANNGIGSTTISYTVSSNAGNTITRYGSIGISGEGQSAAASVTQAGQTAGIPDINLPVSSINAGNGLVNSSIYQSIVIQNTGSSLLNIGSISRSSGSSEFEILPFVNSVSAGEATSVSVRFTPTSVGNKSAMFTISSDDPDEGSVEFVINGAGIVPTGTPATVNLPVNSVDFGSVPVGVIGEKTIEIQNTGGSTLNLSFSQLSGSPDFTLFRKPLLLDSGTSGKIKVRITPSATGVRSATFGIDTNDPVNPSITLTVMATGTVLQPISGGSWQVTQSSSLSGSFTPRFMTLADGNAYMTRSDKLLSVINVGTGTAQANIDFPSFATADLGQVAIVDSKAYVPLGNLGTNGKMAEVNRDTNTVSNYSSIGTEPVAAASYNNRVYAAIGGNLPALKVLYTGSNVVIASIPVGRDANDVISHVAIEPSLGRAYAVYGCPSCNDESGFVGVIDLITNTVVDTIPITSYFPKRIAISGNRAYVSTEASVEVIDLSSDTIEASIMIPSSSREIAATSNYVFVASTVDSATKIIIISTTTNAVVGEMSAGDVQTLVSDPIANTVYAATGSPAPSFKTLKFVAPTFSTSMINQSLAVVQGASTAGTVSLTSTEGWTGQVSLSCSGIPTGGTCQFAQTPVSLTANGTATVGITLSAPGNAVPGQYSIRILADGSGVGMPDVSRETNLTLTVTAACEFILSGTQPFSIGPFGGSGSFSVNTTGECQWSATSSDPSWLTVTSGSSGTGTGLVNFNVAPNTGPERAGFITAGEQTFSVDQQGASTISGVVTYGNAAAPPKYVSNVTVNGTGSPNVFTTTEAPGASAGQYILTGFGSGSYTVSLTKSTGQNGINSFDAARIAQHVTGISLLATSNQRVAADVTGNNTISSQDAAKIAQFVVGLPFSPPNLTGTWSFFVPPGPTFPVGSSPTSRTYASVPNSLAGEDYIGLLLGEVTGNWTNTGARPSGSGGPEKEVETSLPNSVTLVGEKFIVPITVRGASSKDIISYEFDLRYDPSVIQPLAEPVDLEGTVSRGLTAVVNASEPGRLRVVVYGSTPITEDGLLLNLGFAAIGTPGAVTPLSWENLMFNEGDPWTEASNGQVRILVSPDSQREIGSGGTAK